MSEARRISGFADLDESQMSYWKTADGTWMLYLPGCGLVNLTKHTVVEHEDGTISVQPSILVRGHEGGAPSQRHGFLERGIWREVP